MKKQLKHLAHRFMRARKRKKIFALVIAAALIIIALEWYSFFFFYPNTSFGPYRVSGTMKASVEKRIDALLTTPYRVIAQNREYSYTYADLGIMIDREQAINTLRKPNDAPFPVNIFLLLLSPFRTHKAPIDLVFTQQFQRFIDDSIFNFSEGENEIVFDDAAKSLEYIENAEVYRIDEIAFRDLLTKRLGDPSKPLYPKLIKVTNFEAEQITDTANRIKSIFLSPLTVYIQTGGTTKSFILTEKALLTLADITWSDAQQTLTVQLNKELAISMLSTEAKKTSLLIKGNIATPKVLDDLTGILDARFYGHHVDALTIAFDSGPNTSGDKAQKYIEVDISQAKMYLFRDGKLVKEYKVSTGRDYPTPVGEFTILNKVGLGYSNIYDVWLPWWMGFSYSEELHAYFGIHELPYKEIDGKKYQNPGDTIGTPNTGGCVALDVGAAQQVYRFADVGTKVVIYQ